ncbi:MAG TPA: hypothetical protein VFO89_09025, partial [Thermoanaerobaculia bacterium]|nr:hypothetical protein [Thermoanaerobaculia bacterium]
MRIEGNYELVRAHCPACGDENVFNRASDLCTFEPILHLSVECQTKNCRHQFSINGDQIGPAYKTFYYEAYDFVAQKRYSFAILSVVQALELFFAHAVRELWLLKRFKRRGSGDLNELNEALRDLYERTRKFSYVDMR